ncbi:MAG: hypothetical protein A2745_01160 [Candidatus Harrisonbacteria bacterium RIFCSPHIGHO2_01_FULL_44_13]|uniref:Uncharacterized protein n=1 Tax=Candidatus Harrisonbacteria bacterium RIFCSPLOWO2_01_FULL_44_18 TaxID=1798407 RepID=A0A1G1ZM91_9BACT|nr:MAG: hypothetical protein A2745_01160 [Candidatus Harrisonbacteria bacterium RIFCSPHIGHO2_01_FULL_44_13]OGY65712.1 MAG: hypothetical protein A3A16_03805 [Candidatus Harrisonbacteria bacterium RIFCSPLOWO2_01_FULL_44_18]
MLGALLTAAIVTVGFVAIFAFPLSLALKDSTKEKRRNMIGGAAFLAFLYSLVVYTVFVNGPA